MPLGKYEEFSVNTIIGPNTILKGDIEAGGFTRIDGSIIGNVSAKGRVVIGERSRIKGNVSGSVINVGGIVYGNVIAGDSILILSTGLVLGDIITMRIQADEGCFIHGRVYVCSSKEIFSNTLNEHNDAKSIGSVLPVFSKDRKA